MITMRLESGPLQPWGQCSVFQTNRFLQAALPTPGPLDTAENKPPHQPLHHVTAPRQLGCSLHLELIDGLGFPDSSLGKESVCNAGDPSSIPGLGRSPWRRDSLPIPIFWGFPYDSAGKESSCNVGHLGSIPGLGRSPGERKGYPLQILA